MLLTKSNYIGFSQCPKRLWLEKNRKDLLPTEIDPMLRKIFAEAEKIEHLAIQLFPDIAQAYDGDFGQAFVKTRRLLNQNAPAIYQPSFKAGQLFCRSDIIAQTDDGKWDLYEVKSSTQVKEEHLLDLAFQRIVLEESGLSIDNVSVIHVNNSYIKDGEIDPKGMLKIVDVTNEVDAVSPRVYEAIGPAMETMKQKDEPVVPILNQCHRPFECPFIDYCWQEVPEHSIYKLRLDDNQLSDLINKNVIKAEDVPDEMIAIERKQIYLKALKSGEQIIEREEISNWLKQLKYPLYFLDYETYAAAIPMFDGYHPYQNMPFQYSLHVQETPESEIKHLEHLAVGWDDPVPSLAKSLEKAISKEGSVIVWYENFEKGRNKEMGEHSPEFKDFFESVNDRVIDLMIPFKNSWYVDARFGSSASLKAVLPVLVPEMSYCDMGICNGAEATVAWRKMIDRNTPKDESEKIRKDLLAYCDQDTLAMVKILDFLQNLF